MTLESPTPAGRDRADELMRQGKAAEAVPIYRKWVEAHPDEDSHLLALAWALYDSGQSAEAASCFERLFQKELARGIFAGFAYDELVRIYREEGDAERLLSVCKRAGAVHPEDMGILQTLGQAYLSAGRAAEAVRTFEKLVGREGDAPEIRCALGNAWLAAGDPARAESEYRRAAEIDPGSGAALFSRLASVLLRAGYPEKARAAWERCLDIRPDEPLYWMDFGDCLTLLGETDGALDAYKHAVQLDPGVEGGCWHRLGNLLVRQGLHSHAVQAFAHALAAEPENPLYTLRLAAAYAAQGQNDLAEEVLRRAEALKALPKAAG